MLARRSLGRAVACAVAALCLLEFAPPVAAQAQKQPADQATIDNRIKIGVEFLQKEQKAEGFWGTGKTVKEANGIGYTSLVGLTLIECGVKPYEDAGLKKAANIIRANAFDVDSIYELALVILFLDRMKDKNGKNDKTDIRIIQLLAGRLIASQMPSGGWGYKAQKYGESNIKQLVAALNKANAKTNPPPDVTKIRSALPEDMRRLPIWIDPAPRLPADPKDKGQDLYDATTDNSTTHFAMLGLWAARKHEIPVDRTFALVNRRFRTSQGPGGTWAYPFVRTGADGGNQFTCIALLGVAIGHVVAPEPGVKPETDPVIINAFTALSKGVGAPVGDINKRPTVKEAGGLYFLWAMERIAVLYDLQKLNNKDWYLWGAEILICNQGGNGSWDEDGGFPGQQPIINTCFALLFLKRANLTPDLSKKLLVNTGVLTAKVDDKIAPKPEPPPPSPKVEPQPIAIAPMPHAVEPKPLPPAPPPQVTPPAETATETPKKKTPWLFIVLGMALAAVIGGGLAFLLVAKRRKNEEEEEGKKKKKKGKKKAKAEADEPDEDKPAKPEGGKKAKAKVEVEEDE
jgi:hypothetical protein